MGKDKKDKSKKKAAKEEVKAGKGEAAATAETKPSKKKEAVVVENKLMRTISDSRPNLVGLPKHVLEHRINGKSTVSDGTQKVTLAEITGTSTTMYVNDIHSGQPTILEQVYWINTQGERWPISRVTKEEYDWIHDNGTLPPTAHIVGIVDCAVDPTLSYGFRMSELAGLPFPTLQMIAVKDKEFRNNPTYFHNQKPILIIQEKEAAKQQTPTPAEDEDFIMDDDVENKESADEEDFEFVD